jgi:hypothetical protein
MKHLLLAAGLLAGLTLGCKRDASDPAPVDNAALLLGTWHLTSTTQTSTPTLGSPSTSTFRYPRGSAKRVFTASTVETFANEVSQEVLSYSLTGPTYTTVASNGATSTHVLKVLTQNEFVTEYTVKSGSGTNPTTTVILYNHER